MILTLWSIYRHHKGFQTINIYNNLNSIIFKFCWVILFTSSVHSIPTQSVRRLQAYPNANNYGQIRTKVSFFENSNPLNLSLPQKEIKYPNRSGSTFFQPPQLQNLTRSYIKHHSVKGYKGYFTKLFDNGIINTVVRIFDSDVMKWTTQASELPIIITSADSARRLEKQDEEFNMSIFQDQFNKGLNIVKNGVKSISKFAEEVWKYVILLALIVIPFVAIAVTIPMVAVIFASVYLPSMDLNEL